MYTCSPIKQRHSLLFENRRQSMFVDATSYASSEAAQLSRSSTINSKVSRTSDSISLEPECLPSQVDSVSIDYYTGNVAMASEAKIITYKPQNIHLKPSFKQLPTLCMPNDISSICWVNNGQKDLLCASDYDYRVRLIDMSFIQDKSKDPCFVLQFDFGGPENLMRSPKKTLVNSFPASWNSFNRSQFYTAMNDTVWVCDAENSKAPQGYIVRDDISIMCSDTNKLSDRIIALGLDSYTDSNVCLTDLRLGLKPTTRSFTFPEKVSNLSWNLLDQNILAVAGQNSLVRVYDVRYLKYSDCPTIGEIELDNKPLGLLWSRISRSSLAVSSEETNFAMYNILSLDLENKSKLHPLHSPLPRPPNQLLDWNPSFAGSQMCDIRRKSTLLKAVEGVRVSYHATECFYSIHHELPVSALVQAGESTRNSEAGMFLIHPQGQLSYMDTMPIITKQHLLLDLNNYYQNSAFKKASLHYSNTTGRSSQSTINRNECPSTESDSDAILDAYYLSGNADKPDLIKEDSSSTISDSASSNYSFTSSALCPTPTAWTSNKVYDEVPAITEKPSTFGIGLDKKLPQDPTISSPRKYQLFPDLRKIMKGLRLALD